jgi:hypothetical protein
MDDTTWVRHEMNPERNYALEEQMTEEDILNLGLVAANCAHVRLCSISGQPSRLPGVARRIVFVTEAGKRITVAEPSLEQMTVQALADKIGGKA